MTPDLGTSWLRVLELGLETGVVSNSLREQKSKSSGDGARTGRLAPFPVVDLPIREQDSLMSLLFSWDIGTLSPTLSLASRLKLFENPLSSQLLTSNRGAAPG